MPLRRVIPLVVALAVVAAACAGGDRAVQLEVAPEAADGLAMQLAQDESAAALDPDAAIQQTAAQVELTSVAVDLLLDGVEAECAQASAALDRASADLSERTFIAPGNLRCARLAEASLENARIEGVDLSGASLAGANLRNASLSIVAVGVDFTGADLTGADFTGSDLTGAVFNSATLVSSDLSGLATSSPDLAPMVTGGLTGASFVGARLGCNHLEGSPLMDLTGVTFDDSCTASDSAGAIDMTLSGMLLGSTLDNLAFGRVHLVAKDFRAASMQGVTMADHGVLPAGMLFVSADLTAADLSNNTYTEAVFAGANLTGANIAASIIDDSWFSRANLTNTNFSDVLSNHNDYRAAAVTGTNFTGATLRWDDFSGASFAAPLIEGLVVEAVVCDGTIGAEADNGNSVRNFGLCTVGSELIF